MELLKGKVYRSTDMSDLRVDNQISDSYTFKLAKSVSNESQHRIKLQRRKKQMAEKQYLPKIVLNPGLENSLSIIRIDSDARELPTLKSMMA